VLRSALDDDLRDLASLTRDVAEKKIGPLVAEVEAAGTFDTRIKDALAEAGLFGLVVPAEHGGSDCDVRHQVVVLEELGRIFPSACTYLTAHWLATKIIARHATGPGQSSWVAPLLAAAATGEFIGAIGATEPEAGSDLAAIRTRGRRDGDDWVIDGSKRFITNGGFADFYTVLARTGASGPKGISAFYVEADRAGVSATRFEDKMGLHGSATAEMAFDDVRIPADHLIGDEGAGFAYVMSGFDEGRIGVAAMSLGIATGSLEASVRYAGEREQFGRKIAAFQGVQFMVADMAIGVYAARSLVYDAAAALASGHRDAGRIAAIAKTYATDMAMAVSTDAVQVHGGYGYVRDFPVEMFMRDAKIGQIYEGTNQIQRMLIARSYFGALAR